MHTYICMYSFSGSVALQTRAIPFQHFTGRFLKQRHRECWQGGEEGNLLAAMSHFDTGRCFLNPSGLHLWHLQEQRDLWCNALFLTLPAFKYRWKLLSCVRNVTNNIKGRQALLHFPFFCCQLLPPAYSPLQKPPFLCHVAEALMQVSPDHPHLILIPPSAHEPGSLPPPSISPLFTAVLRIVAYPDFRGKTSQRKD